MEYQPRTPEHARFQAWRDDGLEQRLTRLQVLACDRDVPLTGQLGKCRCIHSEVGSRVGERESLHDRGVGVEHARRDGRIVRVQCLLERGGGRVRRSRLEVRFGARAPDHDRAIELARGDEAAHVGAQLLDELSLALPALDVRTVDPAARPCGRIPPARAGSPPGPGAAARAARHRAPPRAPPPDTRPRQRCPRRRTPDPRARRGARTRGCRGERCSVRLPSRMVPICVSEP